jgi:hypothetical protein
MSVESWGTDPAMVAFYESKLKEGSAYYAGKMAGFIASGASDWAQLAAEKKDNILWSEVFVELDKMQGRAHHQKPKAFKAETTVTRIEPHQVSGEIVVVQKNIEEVPLNILPLEPLVSAMVVLPSIARPEEAARGYLAEFVELLHAGSRLFGAVFEFMIAMYKIRKKNAIARGLFKEDTTFAELAMAASTAPVKALKEYAAPPFNMTEAVLEHGGGLRCRFCGPIGFGNEGRRPGLDQIYREKTQ